MSASVLGPDPGDPEDPHDHLYLRETSRKYTKTGDTQGPADPEEFEDAVDPEPQSLGMGAEVLPLHQAILRSVDIVCILYCVLHIYTGWIFDWSALKITKCQTLRKF